MRRKEYLLFFLIVFAISCKNVVKKKDAIGIMDESQSCFSSNEKMEILKSIFESDYILKHIDPRTKKGKTSLKILQNDFLSEIPEMTFRNLPVHFIDSIGLTDETFRLTVSKINCPKKNLSFLVIYPIEGNWYAKGQVNYLDGKFITEITSGGISD